MEKSTPIGMELCLTLRHFGLANTIVIGNKSSIARIHSKYSQVKRLTITKPETQQIRSGQLSTVPITPTIAFALAFWDDDSDNAYPHYLQITSKPLDQITFNNEWHTSIQVGFFNILAKFRPLSFKALVESLKLAEQVLSAA